MSRAAAPGRPSRPASSGGPGRPGLLEAEVPVRAPAAAVWDAVTDWRGQSRWMPATRVRPVDGDGRGEGGRIEAFTGLGPVGFLDPMTVTAWDPPGRCVMRHTGRVVRGVGAFEVADAPAGAVRLVWREELELPAGVLGTLGWRLLEPLARRIAERALTRLARMIEREHTPVTVGETIEPAVTGYGEKGTHRGVPGAIRQPNRREDDSPRG